MKDDFTRNNDDSGSGHIREVQEEGRGVTKTPRPTLPSDTSELFEPHDSESELQGEDENVISASLTKAQLQQWIGPLPPPDIFYKYDDETRELMKKWSNERIVEARRDEVKNLEREYKLARDSRDLATIVLALFALLAFVSFIITRDERSFYFLTVPVLSVFIQVFSKRK